MKSLKIAAFALGALTVLFGFAAYAQSERQDTPLYIIFDGSNSMWGELPDKSRKITVAKDVFNSLDPAIFKEREVALRLYGHRRASDCSDTELAVPFGPANSTISKISEQVNAVKPVGKTPITRSLTAALNDFDGRSGDILLISDGIETCDADPCALVKSWREKNIDIRVHVVGLGLTDRSRSAMQCIAQASDTTYMDANSVSDLERAIESTASSLPPEPAQPNPEPQTPSLEFSISGVDENGVFVPVQGTLHGEGIEPQKISSNNRYVFDGGAYSITVGVPTVNGELYKPIAQEIAIKATGSTNISVKLPRPPTIRSKFMENGIEIRGVIAYAYQDNKEVFRLRPAEDYFVLPGQYKFNAALNKDNQLETSAIISAGDDRDIVFEAIETVHTTFKVFAEGQDKKLRQHQELWQDGELKYKVHVHNGAAIQPGVYTLRSEHVLTPYAIENLEVPAIEKQIIELTVPFGAAQIRYVFAEQPGKKGRRCWVYRVDEQGNSISERSKSLTCDGSMSIMIAGRYFVRTWAALGTFEDTYFDVENGEITPVLLQQK